MSELIPVLRETYFAETGIAIPSVSVRGDTTGLAADAYAIRLHEIPVANGIAITQAALATPEEVIAEHLLGVLRRHGYRFVGIQETQALLEGLERTHPNLVREVVPKLVSPVLLADILQRLAREGLSLRNLVEILGALARRAGKENDAASLAEGVRQALQRQITFKHTGRDESVGVFFLDSMIEETVREAIQKNDSGSYLALEPELSADIVQAVKRAVASVASPVILTASDIRRHLRGLLESEQPQVAVLAHQELTPETKLVTLGRITL
jgi:type III secretory pathway component EscV